MVVKFVLAARIALSLIVLGSRLSFFVSRLHSHSMILFRAIAREKPFYRIQQAGPVRLSEPRTSRALGCLPWPLFFRGECLDSLFPGS